MARRCPAQRVGCGMALITIGSLFSGIGGLELGIERGLIATGHAPSTLWQVEQNDYARQVLARHWPYALRFDDVKTVGSTNLAPVDLICGGFPCQDISTAGNGAGLSGSRSGLFWELHRIVREMAPRIIVLENVPAIRERGGAEVCGALADLGYDLRWGSLSAAEVGAPHKRERWFCVGWRRVGLANPDMSGSKARSADRLGDEQRTERDLDCGREVADSKQDGLHRSVGEPRVLRCTESSPQSEAQQRQRSGPGAGSGGATVAHTGSRRQQRSRRSLHAVHPAPDRAGQADRPIHDGEGQPLSRLGRAPHGLSAGLDAHRWPAAPGPQHPWEPPRTRPRQPHDRDRLKALGNAVVPQCAAVIGQWIGENLLQ